MARLLMRISHSKIQLKMKSSRLGVTWMAEDKRVVSVIEASKILGIGKNLCYEAIRRGEIPALRIGKRLLVPKAALERLLSGVKHD